MSKTLTLPALRLICFGDARSLTNSPIGGAVPEEVPLESFDP